MVDGAPSPDAVIGLFAVARAAVVHSDRQAVAVQMGAYSAAAPVAKAAVSSADSVRKTKFAQSRHCLLLRRDLPEDCMPPYSLHV